MVQNAPTCRTYPTLNTGKIHSNPTYALRRAPTPHIFILLLIFNFIFVTLFRCGLDVEDPTPPDPPQWVHKSLPEEWPERGIDAHESSGIFLEWEPSTADENIKTYHIYRAVYDEMQERMGDFQILVSLDVISDSINSHLDRNISLNVRYAYKMKSEDHAGGRSDFSGTSSYTLIPAVPSWGMKPNGLNIELGSRRKLSWYYNYHIAMENYCLTIRNSDNQLITRQVFTPGTYVDSWEDWQIPDSISLVPGNHYQWRIDLHGNHAEGLERSGSESNWAWFLYSAP